MSKKFISNGDNDFATMANSFARQIAKEPERFFVSRDDAAALVAKVERFRAALNTCVFGGRSPVATRVKEDARGEVEQIIRPMAQLIRNNPRIDPSSKLTLGLRQRTARPKQLSCPQEPPRLRFVRAIHENTGATPMHELSFKAMDHKPKPEGATRLELFVNLIAPDAPIPLGPEAGEFSQPWYLRSYSRSPIRLIPPMARVPMRVLYWARWADAAGNVGPFCRTVTGWVEGGSHRFLAPDFPGTRPALVEIPDADRAAPRQHEAVYRVAVIEAHFQTMGNVADVPELEGPKETRRIEGVVEAA